MTLEGLRDRPSVVVDCDPGIDDALALLFLARLHHGGLLRLSAVVTVAGNADVACTTRNARLVLDRAGLGNVPVIAGSAGPLRPAPRALDALAFHGPDALGGCFSPAAPDAPDVPAAPGARAAPQGAEVAPAAPTAPAALQGAEVSPTAEVAQRAADVAPAAPTALVALHAPEAQAAEVAPPAAEVAPAVGPSDGPRAIVEQLRTASAAGAAVLLALGPLTNVAAALEIEPDLHRLARRVVVMGGAFQRSGNVTPTAEFNWYCDPDAADRVLRSSLPLEVVPLDVTDRVIMGPESLAALDGDDPAGLARDLLRSSIDLHRAGGYACGSQVHDALAAAILAEPDLVRWARLQVRVHTAGEHRVRAVHEPAGASPAGAKAEVKVALEVDAERARKLILSVIGGQFCAQVAPPA